MTKTKPHAKDDDMWGNAEVCRELGVRSSNLSKVVGLPEPDQIIEATRLWRAGKIRKFAAERRARKVA